MVAVQFEESGVLAVSSSSGGVASSKSQLEPQR